MLLELTGKSGNRCVAIIWGIAARIIGNVSADNVIGGKASSIGSSSGSTRWRVVTCIFSGHPAQGCVR